MSEAKQLKDILNMREIGDRESACPKHGAFISHGAIMFGTAKWSECPRCAEEREEAIRAEARARDAELEENRFAFIPERYRFATFDNYECRTEKQRRTVKCLREYAGDRNIVIHGPPGTGKTHLMWALVKTNSGVRYWKLSDIIRRVKCSFAPTARESETEILNELAGKKILVIDELGRQNGTVFETNLVFDLLDMRYNRNLPTILCSNLPLSEGEESIAGYIGAAAMDRINENAVEINCDWENYRKKLAGGTA